MVQNRLCALDVAGCRLYLHERTLTLVANHKIHLQTGILVEIIELPSHLCENISNQVFKDSAFVAVEISLQDVILCAVLQHTHKQPHIAHIHLEGVLLGVAIQRQLGNGEIIAAGDDPRILNPLQASGIFCSGGTFSYNRILEFFIFLSQLTWDRLEALFDVGLILLSRIFHHVVLIRTHYITLDAQYLIHMLAVNKCLYRFRHSADDGILQQKLFHAAVQRIRYRRLRIQCFLQHINDRLGYTVCPQKFLKIQWVHIDHGFRTYGNRFRLLAIAFHTEQRAGADYIVPTVDPKELQRGSRLGAILYLVQHQNGLSGLKYCFFPKKCRKEHYDIINIQ